MLQATVLKISLLGLLLKAMLSSSSYIGTHFVYSNSGIFIEIFVSLFLNINGQFH